MTRYTGRIFRPGRAGLAQRTLMAAALGAGLCGCASNTQTGMLVGGAGGAAAGAAIGSASGHAGTGAVIGGAIGLIGGGLVGNAADQADRRHDEHVAYSATASPSGPISLDDVRGWSHKGTSDEIIIDRIERSGTVFHLTAVEENTLRADGVSDDVVRAMKDTERR